MTLGPLLAFDAAAAALAAGGFALAFKNHRLIVQTSDPAAACYGLRIAGTMVMALGLAGFGFATMYHFSVS